MIELSQVAGISYGLTSFTNQTPGYTNRPAGAQTRPFSLRLRFLHSFFSVHGYGKHPRTISCLLLTLAPAKRGWNRDFENEENQRTPPFIGHQADFDTAKIHRKNPTKQFLTDSEPVEPRRPATTCIWFLHDSYMFLIISLHIMFPQQNNQFPYFRLPISSFFRGGSTPSLFENHLQTVKTT